jgi:hypothetical protein
MIFTEENQVLSRTFKATAVIGQTSNGVFCKIKHRNTKKRHIPVNSRYLNKF